MSRVAIMVSRGYCRLRMRIDNGEASVVSCECNARILCHRSSWFMLECSLTIISYLFQTEVKIKAEHAEDGGAASPNNLEPITAETADRLDGKDPEVVVTACKGRDTSPSVKS